MVMSIASIFVAILIVGVFVWALDHLPAIDATFKQVAKIILIAALVIWAIITIAELFGIGIAHWR